MARNWKPSKAAAMEFAFKMKEINEYCIEHGIARGSHSDSYYFSINGQNYRVSNHSVEASNDGAYDPVTGEQRREFYHPDGRDPDTIYIHASKTRIIEIHTALRKGIALDGRGNPL